MHYSVHWKDEERDPTIITGAENVVVDPITGLTFALLDYRKDAIFACSISDVAYIVRQGHEKKEDEND